MKTICQVVKGEVWSKCLHQMMEHAEDSLERKLCLKPDSWNELMCCHCTMKGKKKRDISANNNRKVILAISCEMCWRNRWICWQTPRGWGWKNAIDSPSLKAPTIDLSEEEMCPQQKSPCVRNFYHTHKKPARTHEHTPWFRHSGYTLNCTCTRLHLSANTGTSFQHRKALRNPSPEVHCQ